MVWNVINSVHKIRVCEHVVNDFVGVTVPEMVIVGHPLTLGADPYLPGRYIESFLRVFKQFAAIYPGGNFSIHLKKAQQYACQVYSKFTHHFDLN